MTTPATMNAILEDLQYRFREAQEKAKCTAVIAPNSYGAGYDLGYSDALGEFLESITGDDVGPSGERS